MDETNEMKEEVEKLLEARKQRWHKVIRHWWKSDIAFLEEYIQLDIEDEIGKAIEKGAKEYIRFWKEMYCDNEAITEKEKEEIEIMSDEEIYNRYEDEITEAYCEHEEQVGLPGYIEEVNEILKIKLKEKENLLCPDDRQKIKQSKMEYRLMKEEEMDEADE